jgi:hypothetical protein
MPMSDLRDARPYRVYVRDPLSGLLIHDGLIYRCERCATREARKITRVLGRPAEARPV